MLPPGNIAETHGAGLHHASESASDKGVIVLLVGVTNPINKNTLVSPEWGNWRCFSVRNERWHLSMVVQEPCCSESDWLVFPCPGG